MNDTNWYVITGAPSSGKTTLINQLRDLGYTVSQEVARVYITQLLLRNNGKLQRDKVALQSAILKLKLERERQFSIDERVIFDRGLPDSIAYYHFNGLDPTDAIAACKHNRYKKVFFCQNLPVVNDGVRVENDAMARELGQLIYEAYKSLDYDIVMLPPVSVSNRTKIILSNLD